MTTDTANKVRRIADVLNETAMGDVVTFNDLTLAIGEDIMNQRFLIYRAQNVAATETGAQFKTIHKTGYQRLHSNELVKIGQSARHRIKNTAKRANSGISAGLRVANDLSPSEMNAILREQTVLGLHEHLAMDKNMPEVPEEEKRPLTPGQAAAIMLAKMGMTK